MRIIDFFDKGANLYPGNTAFLDSTGQCSYQEANRQTHLIASALHSRNFCKGTHVGILAPNSNLAFLVLLGVFRAGGIWLPINPRNSIRINADLLDRLDGELLLFHSDYEAEVKNMVSRVPSLALAVCIDGKSEFGESLSEWTRHADPYFPSVEHSLGDTLSIFPTGSATAPSKDVVVTHRNIATVFANFYAHFHYYDDTRHLIVAPMSHSTGVLGCLHFARGGSNIIMDTVDPGGIFRAIQTYHITHLLVPPQLLYMMLAHPEVTLYDYSSLQHFTIGAAQPSFEKLKQAIEVFGPVMTECYGQPEAPSIVTAKAPWDYLDDQGKVIESRLKTMGRPAVFNQVAIMGSDGDVLDVGKAGEIVLFGDLVTPGYCRNSAGTSEVRKSGWYHTGDIGVMDGEGFITAVDRKKDM